MKKFFKKVFKKVFFKQLMYNEWNERMKLIMENKGMHTDSFIHGGTKNNICEDYIIDGHLAGQPFVVLSDGCSSSDRTDVGARLMCHHAPRFLRCRKHEDIDGLGVSIITAAQLTSEMLAIPSSCLDATLIIAHIPDDDPDTLQINMFGDGIIIVGFKDTSILIYDTDFDSNAPYYLSYKLNPKYDEIYHKQVEHRYCSTYTNINTESGNVIFERSIASKAPSFKQYTYPISELKFVLIASDGLKSFMRHDGSIIDPVEVFNNVLSFKSMKGEFLQRRVGRMISNYEKGGTTHYDDISIGGIVFEEVDE